MVVAPDLVLQGFLDPGDAIDPLALEVQRWFGVMCFAFGGVLLGITLFGSDLGGGMAAPQPWTAVSLLLKCFLVADVLYVTVFARWCHRRGFWNPACIFNVGFGAALPLARLAVLRDPGLLLPAQLPDKAD